MSIQHRIGIEKMSAHQKICDIDPGPDWVLITPPDATIPYCPTCRAVVLGLTVVLQNDASNVAHPCHHELSVEESEVMLETALTAN